jgi:Na+-driven multidrug efflux pump
MACAARQ